MSTILVFAILGAIAGWLANLLDSWSPVSFLQYWAGVTFGIFSFVALYKMQIRKPIIWTAVLIFSILGYVSAYFVCLLTIHLGYYLSMSFAGLAGALILSGGYAIAKMFPDSKAFYLLLVVSIIASLLTPPNNYLSDLSSGIFTPNIWVLFPLWQGLVGGYVGWLVYQKTKATLPQAIPPIPVS